MSGLSWAATLHLASHPALQSVALDRSIVPGPHLAIWMFLACLLTLAGRFCSTIINPHYSWPKALPPNCILAISDCYCRLGNFVYSHHDFAVTVLIKGPKSSRFCCSSICFTCSMSPKQNHLRILGVQVLRREVRSWQPTQLNAKFSNSAVQQSCLRTHDIVLS